MHGDRGHRLCRLLRTLAERKSGSNRSGRLCYKVGSGRRVAGRDLKGSSAYAREETHV